MKKIIEYFKHDYKARTDPKLIKLRMKKDFAGLGLYWCIIEMIYEAGGFLKYEDLYASAFELNIDEERLKEIIDFPELFVYLDIKKEYTGSKPYFVTSERVLSALGEREERSQQSREAANKRWHKTGSNAPAKQAESEGNASKEKKKKEEKSKEEKSKEEDLFTEVLNSFEAECCPPMPKVSQLNDQRKGQVRARLKEHGLIEIKNAFMRAGNSKFLTGKKNDFVASFDFLIKKANFIKLIEGNYDNNGGRNQANDYNHDEERTDA